LGSYTENFERILAALSKLNWSSVKGDTFGEVPVKRLLISALRSSGAPFKQHTPLLSTFLG
jgi:hypothetical protein